MKAEEALEIAVRNPDFLAESGSRLYGTSTPTSDHDLRGFVMPPYDYLIGLKTFNDRDLEGDHKIYSISRFLELIMKGDPQCTELLFAPEAHIFKRTEIGEWVLSLKNSLLSNAIFNRIMGYSVSEWRKAMAIKLVSVKEDKTKKDVINDIRSHWDLDKEKMDEIIRILDSVDEKECVSSMSGLGVKRRKDVEEHGYCRKSAAHSIRLLTQLKELLLTGNITFPRPDADLLLKIRNGEFEKEELNEIHKKVEAEAKEAREKSVLQNKPDAATVWKVYELLVARQLSGKDERFNNLVTSLRSIDV